MAILLGYVGSAMNGGTGNNEDTNDDELTTDGAVEETVVIESNENIDNVGDISVELNVEELVAKIESGDTDDLEDKRVVKKRLEELEEEIGSGLEGTYNINLDDDS